MTHPAMPTQASPTSHGHARRTRRLLLIVTCALLLAGLVWGIGGALAADPSASPDSGKVTLKLGWLNQPDSLNPFVGYEGSSYEVWALNYDLLVGYATDGSPAPGLAESWSVSDDGLTWTFKIRQGMTWQDGEPITANDIAFTYNLIIDKNLTALTSYTKNIKEARVVDDYTVDVVCSKPKANMETLWIYIVPEHIWSKVKDPEKVKQEYPIVGSGPFQCVEWNRGSYVKMVKNPNYWGKEPAVDEVLFEYYTSADTMTQDLKSGLIDGANDIAPAQYSTFENQPGFDAIAYNLYYWEYLGFNCYQEASSLGNPVLRNIDFRNALNWAIDKQKCVDVAWNGRAVPGTTMIPPDQFPADWDAHWEPPADVAYGFDLEKAKQLLDEGGYTDSDGDGIREYKGKPIKLRLWARSESLSSQSMGKFITGWFQDIGLDIEFQVFDDGAISDKLYNYDKAGAYAPDYDMYIWDYWGAPDPGDTLAWFATDQIEWWNDPCWSNAEFDQLIADQYGELDKPTRLDMIHRAQEVMYSETPEIILDYPPSLQVVNTDRWQGWTPFKNGGVWYVSYNIDTYLNLQPKVAEEETGGGNTALTVGIIIVVAIIALAIIAVIIQRRRRVSEME
jgi:peptide/nickel transport system substrate-binding protein